MRILLMKNVIIQIMWYIAAHYKTPITNGRNNTKE